MSYRDTVNDRLAHFLTRFLPGEERSGYSQQFLENQLGSSLKSSRVVASDGTIDAEKVARHMDRYYNVEMPDSLDDDSYVNVELGGSE